MATLRVVTPLKDTKIAEGGWAVLSLELNDILSPELARGCSVVWRKDKTPIDINNAFKYHSYCSLGLVSLQIINFDPKADSGLYECLVTSSTLGSVTSYCRVAAIPKWQLKAPTSVFSAKPVTFFKPLKDIKVKENQKLILTVSLSEAYMNTPVDQSEFKWNFNNEPIVTDEETCFSANHVSSSRLMIPNIRQYNDGHYSVEWNDLKSFCRVSVLPSLASINIPNFLKPLPKESKLLDGKKSSFDVIVKGKPFPEVSWTLDGVSLQPSDGVSTEADSKTGECSLTINFLTSKDSGKKLMCSLKNDKGKAECISVLQIEPSPTTAKKVELKAPSPTKLNSLKKIVFDAIDEDEVLANDPSVINRSHSTGSRGMSSDRGGGGGSGGREGDGGHAGKFLEIVKPLEITSSNSGLITLACVVEGEPKPQISWYKNANILRKSKTTEFLFDGKTANLLIKPDDSGGVDEIIGAYTCRAENMFEQKQTSINISKTSLNSLSLKRSSHRGDHSGTNNGENSSGPSTIDRHARTPSTSSMPAATIGGKQSTESLVSTDSRALTTPASVGLKKKGAMRRTSSAVFLRLLAPLQDQELKVGDTLTLSCTISCSERPIIFWYLDGEELDLDDSQNVYSDGKCTLCLKNVDKLYEGVYECIIQSGQTEITSCCSVKVRDPNEDQPKMLLPWEDMEILVGDPVSLFAQFFPDNCAVKWFKDELELAPKCYSIDQGSSQLTLENLLETAEVSIVVTSPTTGKTATNKCKVVVHAIPIEIISKTSDCSFAIGESCSFYVEFKSEAKVTAEWFQNGKIRGNSNSLTVITAEGKSQVVIQKFSKDLTGQWTCVLSDEYVSLQHSFSVSLAENKAKPQSPMLKLGNKANAKPVKILKQLENCNIKEGKPLKLECQLSQNISEPKISWFHDNNELKNTEACVIRYVSGVASLNIHKTHQSSGGQYSCNVTLPSGEELSSKCLVKVPRDSVTKTVTKDGTKPTIKAQSKKNNVIKAGKAFELSCEVFGSPQPSVKWLHNGIPFSNSSAISNGIAKVTIPTSKETDAGLYQCIATNENGETITEFTVEIESGAEKPVFARKLENTEVKEGKPLKLSVKITSPVKPKVTWVIEGKELVSGENGVKISSTEQIFTLNISSVKSDLHAGTVECQAENNSGLVSTSCIVKVLSKPVLTKSLQDTFASPGSTVALECHFTAQSVPKGVWYKNGTRIFQVRGIKSSLENGVAKLEIGNFAPSSTGIYLIKLTNNEGEVTSSCKIDIYRQPVFKKHLAEKIDAVFGKLLKLECCIEGVCESDIVWYHNETVLSPKTYAFEKGNLSSISFENCTNEQEGTYTCIASHSGGSALSTCTVSVCSLPEIHPVLFCENLELVANDALKLSVQVNGKPVPSLQWFFKDNLIYDKPGLTLSQTGSVHELCLDAVATQNSGEYLCVAKNAVGITKLACLVSVVASGRSAQFSKNLDNVTVKEGSLLKLETCFNAFGSFTSKWFSDNHEVKETQTVKIAEKPTSSTLVIENAERCWSGTFLYEVVNRFGRSATSCNVVVLFTPVFTKKLDSHFYVNRSSASTLEVQFESQPVPEVTWKRDDQILESSEQMKIHSTDSKSILHVLEPQGGKYMCMLTNEIGSSESVCQVVVMDVPKFDKPLQDREVKEGEDVTLECSIIAFPLPEVNWFFNDKKLGNDSDDSYVAMHSGNTYTLLIKNASRQNHGTYKVIASNQAGTNAQTCCLKVCDIPEITCLRNKLTDDEISVEENDEFEIDFAVKVKSDPVIKWFFKDQPIVNSIRVQTKLRAGIAKLYITKCTAEDSGEYSIVVRSNSDGTQRSQTFFVQVYTKPTFQMPLKKTMKVITQQELILECKVSGFPEPMLFWYHDNEILEESERLSIEYENSLAVLKIASCFLEDSGVYNCKAINTVATTSSTCDVNIYSFPEFLQGLSDIVIEKGKNIELVCKVSAHPPPSVKWYQKGRELRNSNDIHVSQSGDEFSLVIKNSKFSHAAEYTCKASNIVGEAVSQCYVEVGTLPIFKQELKKMADIISGNKLVLQIEYTSRPIPEVKWFRDGTELSLEDEKNCSFYHDEKSMASLTFDPVNIDHQGFYECVVENVMSSAKCDCRVFVYSVPKFVDSLEDLEIVENEDLLLRCKVIGHPEPKVAWSFNSKELDDLQNEDCDLEYDNGIAVLKISKAKRTYSGKFSCKAFNSAGESTSECSVDVLVLPTFLEFPSKKEVEIDSGDNFEIEAMFEGSPLPSVAWFKNETRLEQSGNCSINIDESKTLIKVVNCQAEDSATYKCCLTNKLSTVSRQVHIVILSAPVVNLPQDYLNLSSGENHILELMIIASPKPTLTCTVNKLPLTKFPQLSLNDKEYKLCFSNIDSKLAGIYNFKVENKVGKTEFNLKVNVLSAPSFLKPLETQQVNIGDDLYLLVTLNSCFPEPQLLWKHNERPLVVSEEFGILMRQDGDQYMLIRENVSFDFVGEYSCEVSNSQGKCESRAKITVEELLIKPKLEKAIRDVFVDESKPLEIVCHFVASPKPIITWFKDSKPISEEDNQFKITRAQKTAMLKIESAQLTHTGPYMVKISNKVGDVQSSFKVSVKELIIKPKIVQPLVDIATIEFETIVLKCGFEAKPAPEITWYFNNVALTKKVIGMLIETSASESKLILENVIVKRAGNYKCRVKNKAGMTSSACKLDIEVKPIPPALVMDERMEVSESSDITIKCLIEGNPFPGVKWLKNEKVLTDMKYYEMYVNSGGVACLGFREVRVSDFGIYQCLAVNAYGEARSNIELIVNRKPVKPEFKKPLANKIVREGQSCTMTCEVTGYPVPEVTCYHDGYELDADSHVQVVIENEILTLNIEKTELDHAGIYSVKAMNEVDMISCKAKLTVQAAPKTKPVFEVPMEHFQVMEGDSVVLSNKIVAHPTPSISWLLGGRRILSTKNQELKFQSGIATLSIKKAMKTQAGEYTCIASNSEGETRVSCNLTTKSGRDENRMLNYDSLSNVEASAPQILRDLRDIVCQEGQNITLECKFAAVRVSITWKLNGNEIKPSDDFVITKNEDSTSLQIRNTKVINEGQFSVTLENQMGYAESFCQVSVGQMPEKNLKNVPPHFIKALQDIDVEDGQRVVLECKVGGPEPIEVHWLFAGEELQSHGDFKISYLFGIARLEILEVFPEDCGDYLCLARNDFGHVKTECFINVLEPDDVLKSSEDSPGGTRTPEKPVLIKELPEEFMVIDGDPCILEVKVRCYPDPEVIWMYNGEAIEMTEYLSCNFQNGIAQLKFDDIYPTDAGLYECRVQNAVGFVTSSCMLSVDEEMKTEEILIQLQQSLSQENFRGIKSPSRHSSGSIRESPSSNTMSSLNVHQWTIDKSLKMRKQSGKAFVLTSDLQDRDFVPAISNVRCDKPPFLVKKLRDLNVEHAESFKMECKLSHRSDAEVAWFLNGLQVKSNDNILITFEDKVALFEVLKATPDLSGEIMCKAINQQGEVSSRCQIKVFPKMRIAPQFTSELFDLTCEEQDNLTLTCELDCDSETEVEWYFNDRALPKFSKDIKMTFDNPVAKLEINSAMVLDSGRYTCEAFNSVGESYSWCDVCVQEVVSGLSPIFVEKLTNKTVMEGEPCELKCSLQEYRGVEVKWLLNGKPLVIGKDMDIVQSGNVLKIVFTKTRVANAGKYTCKAIGRSSSTWTGCEVTVGGVPKFVNKLENTKVQISDDLHLQCELSGHPIPTVSWFHNKKPVKIMRNYNTGYQGQKAWLRIEKADLKHAGEYLCKISNSFGEAISVCEVGVGASPGFLEELEDILVVTDKPFQLVCEISGVPSPYIEWYHPDEHTRLKISRNVRTKFIDGTATLLIDRAVEEMAGIYHCKALNSFGKAVSTCKVTIGSLPEVLTNIEDQNVTVGETVKFECMFSSESNPIVVWLLNGCNVAGTEGVIQDIGSDWASLTLSQCLASQAGEYICKIVNDFGEVLSKAILTIGSPPVFTKKPRDLVKLSEGKPLKLTAEIDGSPRPRFEWLFNESPIEEICPTAKVTSRDNILFLDIDKMTSKYAGKYFCNLTNDFGSQQSMTKVIIGCSPEISSSFPSEMRVNIGEPLVIVCEFNAFPEPEVTWLKDKRQLSEKLGEIVFSEPKHNVCQLKYVNAKAGTYSVKLKNNYGEITGDCKVEVGGKPVLVKGLKNERFTEGMSAKLLCEFSSMPEAQISWFINGVVITKYSRDHKMTAKEGKACLEIHRVNSMYFGEHQVKASNMFGETITSCEIENALLAKKPTIRTLEKPARKTEDSDEFSTGYKSHTIARTSVKPTVPEIEITKREVSRSLSDSKSKQKEAEENSKTAEVKSVETTSKLSQAQSKPDVKDTQSSSKVSESQDETKFGKDFESGYSSEKVSSTAKLSSDKQLDKVKISEKPEVIEPPRTPKEKRKALERKPSMKDLKPSFAKELPTSVNLKTGEKLELYCQSANEIVAQSEVSWFHNGTILRPFLGVEVSTKGTDCNMSIPNVKLRHSGRYECKIVNKSGQNITSCDVKVQASSNPALQFNRRTSIVDISKQESMIQLPSDSEAGQISKKPVFTRKLNDVRLFGGDNLKLECAVTGYPEPTVKWFRDSQRIPEFNSIENGKILVEISNVSTQHAGIYMCKVTNTAGSASCTCRVTITGTLRRRNSLMTKSKATLLEPPIENKELSIKSSEENVKLRGSKDALTIADAKKKTLSCVELKTVPSEDATRAETPKLEELPEIKESPKKGEEPSEETRSTKEDQKIPGKYPAFSSDSLSLKEEGKESSDNESKKVSKILEKADDSKTDSKTHKLKSPESLKSNLKPVEDDSLKSSDLESKKEKLAKKGSDSATQSPVVEKKKLDKKNSQESSKDSDKSDEVKVFVRKSKTKSDDKVLKRQTSVEGKSKDTDSPKLLKKKTSSKDVSDADKKSLEKVKKSQTVETKSEEAKSEKVELKTDKPKLTKTASFKSDLGEDEQNSGSTEKREQIVSKIESASEKSEDESRLKSPETVRRLKPEEKPSKQLKEKSSQELKAKDVDKPKPKLMHAEVSRISFIEEKASDLSIKRPKKISCDSNKCKHQCTEVAKSLDTPKIIIAPRFEPTVELLKRAPSQDESDQCSTPTQLSRSSSKRDVISTGPRRPSIGEGYDSPRTLERRPKGKLEGSRDLRRSAASKRQSSSSIEGELSPSGGDTSATSPSVDLASPVSPGSSSAGAAGTPQMMLSPQSLPELPSFSLKLTDVSVQLSKDISLICRVKGVPKSEIIWCKDGRVLRNGYKHKMLEDAGLNILEIRGVKLDDEATYTCKARNTLGQSVSECHLKVVVVHKNCLPLSPPMFLRPVLDIVVPSEGQTARFEAQVHPGSNSSEMSSSSVTLSQSMGNISEPSLEICWFKDEELINIDENSRYKLDCSRSGFYALLIDEIGEDDIGTYYCIATNSNGQRIFSAANLTIDTSVNRYSVSRHDEDDSKSVADSFATCDDAKSIVSTSTDMQSCITGATHSATGSHFRRRDSTNSMQSAFSDTTSIVSDINDPGSSLGGAGGVFGDMPTYQICEFVTKPQGGVFNEGSNVELTANVSGYPLPVIEWFRNGKLLKSAGRISIVEDPTSGKGTLKIRQCDLTDAGEYTVAANNTVNAIYAVVNVSIQECEEEEEEEEEEDEDDDEEDEAEEAEDGIEEEEEEEGTETEEGEPSPDDNSSDVKSPEPTESDASQRHDTIKLEPKSPADLQSPEYPPLPTKKVEGRNDTLRADDDVNRTLTPSLGQSRATGVSESPASEKRAFFGSNYKPEPEVDSDDDDDDESMTSPRSALPTINLPETSPGFFDTLGEDSLLVNEIFETLKMKKQFSNTSNASIDSSYASSMTRTPLDVDSVASPAVDSPHCHPVLRKTDSYGTSDDVFADKKLAATSTKTSNSKLSPDASPPTRERPISPRMKTAYSEMPKVPPEILHPLTDVTVSSGSLVNLECTFSMPMPDTIQWFRNNELVQTNHSIAFNNDPETGKASLCIHAAIPLDEGIYEVVGKNVLGVIQSSAFLKVEANQLRRISESDEDTMCESVKTDDGSNTVVDSSCSASRRVSMTSNIVSSSFDDSNSALGPPDGMSHAHAQKLGCVPAYILKSVEDLRDQTMNSSRRQSVTSKDKQATSPVSIVDSYFQVSSPRSRDSAAENSSGMSLPDPHLSEGGGGASGSSDDRGGFGGGGGIQSARKRKPTQNDSASSETDDRTSGEFFELYRSIANYQPAASHRHKGAGGGGLLVDRADSSSSSSDDSIWLSEGQFVEVLDNSNANKWMVRTKASKNSPVRIGWVPSSFLEKVLDTIELKRPGSWNFDSESSEAAHHTLKKQVSVIAASTAGAGTPTSPTSAIARQIGIGGTEGGGAVGGKHPLGKRVATSASNLLVHSTTAAAPQGDELAENKLRLAMQELFVTEEAYVSDLQVIVDKFIPALRTPSAPAVLKDKSAQHRLFINVEKIYKFNSTMFLPDLRRYKNMQPEEVGNCFLNWQESFEMYVQYCQHKESAHKFLSTSVVKTFFDDYLRRLGIKMDLGTYLIKPVQRITKYHLVLKEILKYASKLKRDTGAIERALSVMIELPARANNLMQIDSIVDCPLNLDKLGPLIMIDDVTVWESKPRTQGKERTLFLFRHMILFTKKKTDHHSSSSGGSGGASGSSGAGHASSPVYCYKKHMQVAGVAINFKDKDDKRRFELYMGRREVTTNFSIIQAKSFYKKEAWVKEILTLQAKDNEEIQDMRSKAKSRRGVTRNSEPFPFHVASGFDSLHRKLGDTKEADDVVNSPITPMEEAVIGGIYGIVYPCGPGFQVGDNVEIIEVPSNEPPSLHNLFSPSSIRKKSTEEPYRKSEPLGSSSAGSGSSGSKPGAQSSKGTPGTPASSKSPAEIALGEKLVWVRAITGSKTGECAQIKRDCMTKHQQVIDEGSATPFKKVIKDQEVYEGQFLELDVIVDRRVTCISWLKGDDILSRTSSVGDLSSGSSSRGPSKERDPRMSFESNFMTGEHKMSISECVLSDSGHYKCRAEQSDCRVQQAVTDCSATVSVLRSHKTSSGGGSETTLSQIFSNTLKRHTKKSRTADLPPIKPKISRAASTNLSDIASPSPGGFGGGGGTRPKLIVSPSEDESPSPCPSSVDLLHSPVESPRLDFSQSHNTGLSSSSRKLSAFLETSFSRFKANRHVSDDNLATSVPHAKVSTSSQPGPGYFSGHSTTSPLARVAPRRAETINMGSEYVRKPRRKTGSGFDLS